MKSTSGAHFVALDHIRAVAALLVFVWHFIHGQNGYPVPFDGAPIWGPFVFFDEGHVGVALFMTLSGYLFAKLLDGKRIIFHSFLLNRILRLFPLLLLVMLINVTVELIKTGDPRTIYWNSLNYIKGFVYPKWPNGGWSIAAELHFYMLLPLLLFLRRISPSLLFVFVMLAMAFRAYFYASNGEVQSIAYWTILGRVDQFILGILGFHFSDRLKQSHKLAGLVVILFTSIYYWFDVSGGFYQVAGSESFLPRLPSSLWIWLPTVEGGACAVLIAWYDSSFKHTSGFISKAISRVGEYSYSIYLLHYFVVFTAADWINTNVMHIGNFYAALFAAVLAFLAMIPIGYLSMRYIESPFLRLRKRYYVQR